MRCLSCACAGQDGRDEEEADGVERRGEKPIERKKEPRRRGEKEQMGDPERRKEKDKDVVGFHEKRREKEKEKVVRLSAVQNIERARHDTHDATSAASS